MVDQWVDRRAMRVSTDGPRPAGVLPGKVMAYTLADNGIFPNNALRPLLVYKGVFQAGNADYMETVFVAHGWDHGWRNGVLGFHHYHSTAHEVLGAYAGRARIQFGGDDGPVLEAAAGDVVVVPAGVAHNNLGSSNDFRVVGYYPNGQDFDMNYGRPGERPQADHNIAMVPLPAADPVYGASGPVVTCWQDKPLSLRWRS